MSDTVPFQKQAVKDHIDECIRYWRGMATISENRQMATHYVDAFQSMRMSLFGELLEQEEMSEEDEDEEGTTNDQ